MPKKKTDLELIGLLKTHSITQFDKTRIEIDGNLVVLRIVSPDMNDLHKKNLSDNRQEKRKIPVDDKYQLNLNWKKTSKKC